ncbi:MAG: hypothetical protein IJU50_08095, partial [Lachnospiraceae bacterium]|nr:hypothetical protein [Lachnospiraceae bacterium]
TSKDCSQAIADIINRSMNPAAELRYQTADEMLAAFRGLHKNDPRVRRHKRHMLATALLCGTLFLCGGALAFTGMRQLKQRQGAIALAAASAEALRQGDVQEAVSLSLDALTEAGKNPPAEAQLALANAVGVYDLSDHFQDVWAVSLPSKPFHVEISPNGKYAAFGYAFETLLFDLEGLSEIETLPMENSALADICFLDDNTLLYAGEKGVSLYDITSRKSTQIGEKATALCVSGDRKIAAAVNRDDGYAVLYDLVAKTSLGTCDFDGRQMNVPANDTFADPEEDVFALNQDGSLLAVSFSDGTLELLPADGSMALSLLEESDYTRFHGGFSGDYFAYTASNGGGSVFEIADLSAGEIISQYESDSELLLQVNEKGILLAEGGLLSALDLSGDGEEMELAFLSEGEILAFSAGEAGAFVSAGNNTFSYFGKSAALLSTWDTEENADFVCFAGDYALIGSRSLQDVRVLKNILREDADFCQYDARYDHDEARLSADEETIMLFSIEGFRIYDRHGEILEEVSLPDPDHIYDQQFRKNEVLSYLEVTWYDGTIRSYSAKDGSVISEETGAPPSKELREVFDTGAYRVESALHEEPKIYDAETNKLLATLTEEAFLTYASPFQDGLIVEFANTEGNRYGYILDSSFEKTALLPHLCDITEDGFLFDDYNGHLRKSPFYNIEELKEMAEELR